MRDFPSILLLLIGIGFNLTQGQVWLRAQGTSDAYKTINDVLGGNSVEVPDCGHESFGKHITQGYDFDLQANAFTFHAHVDYDDDRCEKFDRQRTEIKTYGPSDDYLKGFHKDRVSYSWDFRLDSGFLPSTAFTHIHQIKGGDGPNVDMPLITFTPRRANPNRFELMHYDSNNLLTKLSTTGLSGFVGGWVHVVEEMTLDSNGVYSLEIRRLSDGAQLFSYSNDSIDLWRDGSTFMRPKWGIYRSLTQAASLRDEKVGFANFCLAKGNDKCL